MKKISLRTAFLLRNIPILLFPLCFAAHAIEIKVLSRILLVIIMSMVIAALILEKLLKKENSDEMAQTALKKADSICFRLSTIVLVLAATVFLLNYESIIQHLGWITAAALSAVTLVNIALFYYFDKKGQSKCN